VEWRQALDDGKRTYELEEKAQYAQALPLHQKLLAERLRVLGENHPQTADCHNNIAYNLHSQGKYAEAEPFYRRARAISQKSLGEEHPETATVYDNLAMNLDEQGKYGEAEALYHRALALRQKSLGESHAHTAQSYNNLAAFLYVRGRYAEAELLTRRALAIYQKTHGDEHPHTTTGYSNLAANLEAQGKYAEAEPLLRHALALRQKLLGDAHPKTASGYSKLGLNLHEQAKYAEAEPLIRWALAPRQDALGEEHPDTAISYNNLGLTLDAQGRPVEAEVPLRKALAIWRQALGEEHLTLATSYTNLSANLSAQGKYGEAESASRRALAIARKALGEESTDTAFGYNNLAANLNAQGRHAEAESYYQRALAIWRKVQGEGHRLTVTASSNLALSLAAQGKHAEAEPLWDKAARGFEMARLAASVPGLARATFATHRDPYAALAASRAARGQAVSAWQALESHLGRGVLEEQVARQSSAMRPDERREQEEWNGQLARLAAPILTLASRRELTPAERQRLDGLLEERTRLETRLADLAVRVARREIVELPAVQALLPADGALVAWVDVSHRSGAVQDHWVCLVRKEGEPRWERLAGSGPTGAWTKVDEQLPLRVRERLGRASTGLGDPLLTRLRAQRLGPIEKHLSGVKRLIVLPVGSMAGVPVEALAEGFTVSYALSATVLTRLHQQRPTRSGVPRLLAVGDPVFPPAAKMSRPTPPGHGLFLSAVLPGGNAAKAGLHPGDVLLRYGGQKLDRYEDLQTVAEGEAVTVQVWRDGETLRRSVQPGELGATLSKQPAAEGVRSWRDVTAVLERSRRGRDYEPLPGTRKEVAALAALLPNANVLLGQEATELRLEQLAKQDQLKQYRILHFATHGEVDDRSMRGCALVLSQLDVPDKLVQALTGKKGYDGKLNAGEILDTWRLDADLVTLSACQTGLGQEGGGEGLMGFSQALLSRGARSVVLSLWKVDDTATALLMVRFYENWLGKRADLMAPLPKAEALREAKHWLRNLSPHEAQRQAQALPRGKGQPELPLLPGASRPEPAPKDEKPYAHPYYWAAFILIGDPE
jgi:tetratricopeptide (TPR) repeat protein